MKLFSFLSGELEREADNYRSLYKEMNKANNALVAEVNGLREKCRQLTDRLERKDTAMEFLTNQCERMDGEINRLRNILGNIKIDADNALAPNTGKDDDDIPF